MSSEVDNKVGYFVPKGEEHLYHVKVELVQYNQKTGVKISRPQVKKFGAKIWINNLQSSLRKQGYKIEVLHNPTEWAKIRAIKAAEYEKKMAEFAKKTEEEQKAAEREAMKQEILAEVRAAGLLGEEEKPKRGRPKKEETEVE